MKSSDKTLSRLSVITIKWSVELDNQLVKLTQSLFQPFQTKCINILTNKNINIKKKNNESKQISQINFVHITEVL